MASRFRKRSQSGRSDQRGQPAGCHKHLTPHDALVKEAFHNPQTAISQLRAVLPPALLQQLDLDSLTICSGTFHDEKLAESQSDVLYSVRIRGQPGLLYALVEAKSRPDKWVLVQLLRYLTRIYEQFLAHHRGAKFLPLIIPIVLHHSPSGWNVTTSFLDLVHPMVGELPELGKYVPSFEFILDDLSHVSDQALRARALGALGSLAAVLLRDARTPGRLSVTLPAWADCFREMVEAPDGIRALLIVFRYISSVADPLTLEQLADLVRNIAPKAEGALMTIAEQLTQEGIEKGIEKGTRQVVKRHLERQFGPLSEALLATLEAASLDELNRWDDRLFRAESLEDVFAN